MHYFISILFALLIFSVGAEEKDSTAVKSDTAVPHNNGTQGLLKNTFIEPIDNFNSIGSEIKKPKSTEKKSPPKQQTEQQTQADPSTKREVNNNSLSSPQKQQPLNDEQAELPI